MASQRCVCAQSAPWRPWWWMSHRSTWPEGCRGAQIAWGWTGLPMGWLLSLRPLAGLCVSVCVGVDTWQWTDVSYTYFKLKNDKSYFIFQSLMTSLSLDSIHSALVSLHASPWEWASSVCPAALLCRSVVSDSLGPPWTAAPPAPLAMGFPRQEYWSGPPCPPPGDLPDPGMEPMPLASPALAGRFFHHCTTWEAPSVWKKSNYL